MNSAVDRPSSALEDSSVGTEADAGSTAGGPESVPGDEQAGAEKDPTRVLAPTTDRLATMRPVRLAEVGVALPETFGRMTLEAQDDSGLRLTIPVSLEQASQLAVALHGIEVPRPLASDLVISLFTAFDVNLDMVAITGLSGGNYLAEIVATASNGRHRRLPARASDAVVLATRVRPNVPIMVFEGLLR